MQAKGYIDVTDLDYDRLVTAAFSRSKPQGLGHLHHWPGPITTAEINSGINGGSNIFARYDYVRGRSMKLILFTDHDRLYWRVGWYDHTDDDQFRVLVAAGMTEAQAVKAIDAARNEIKGETK